MSGWLEIIEHENMAVAIKFEGVTKYYRKGPRFLPSLRDWAGVVVGKRWGLLGERFAALDGVSLEIDKGEVVGFIGPNGAGKTTVLKLISRVTYADEGRIERDGSVAGLLELEAGFHPELTGGENIILNGMILGLTRKEIKKRLNEIVEYSGIEEFLDTPVKFYSTGMKARLGFSVAIHVRSEILLVDEVLAVGDKAFQKKCLGTMKAYCADKNRTVVFVSHNMRTVKRLCNRVIYLSEGRVRADGSPEEVIKKYLEDQVRD